MMGVAAGVTYAVFDGASGKEYRVRTEWFDGHGTEWPEGSPELSPLHFGWSGKNCEWNMARLPVRIEIAAVDGYGGMVDVLGAARLLRILWPEIEAPIVEGTDREDWKEAWAVQEGGPDVWRVYYTGKLYHTGNPEIVYAGEAACGMAWVNPWLTGGCLDWLVAHEVGHLLGHRHEGPMVMVNPYATCKEKDVE